MFLVDTNVLVHAADQASPYHKKCHELIEKWANQPSAWFCTWPVLYEFMRVVSHPRVLRSPWPTHRAWSFLDQICTSPGFQILAPTERHSQVLAQVISELPHLAGNIMHDTHTAVLMREHGVRRIYTRDTDFHRFPFLEPIDPVRLN